MKKEVIMDALNLLDTEIIEETDRVRNNGEYEKTNKKWHRFRLHSGKNPSGMGLQAYQPVSLLRRNKWKLGAVAAVSACLIFTVYSANHSVPEKPADVVKQPEKLPMLTIAENTSGDMGFEGYLAYSISDLVNNNPWNESKLPETLPVYQNQLSYDEHSIVSGADFGKMRERLIEIAGRLGLESSSLEITDNAPDEETKRKIMNKEPDMELPDGYFNPTELITQTDGMEIRIDQAMEVTIFFEPAISLPDKYNFTDSASYEETLTVANYLQDKYQKLIDMEHPQINISDGDYSYDLQQYYQINFFDTGKNSVEQIINYNFNQITFYSNDHGKLDLVRIRQTDLSQKTGDYPVITAEEAKTLLLKGNYMTTVPYELPGANYIAKTELVYRTGTREDYFMPYYRFYVELPEEERDGLKNYGIYYVPAVEENYIKNMPLWDGSFN